MPLELLQSDVDLHRIIADHLRGMSELLAHISDEGARAALQSELAGLQDDLAHAAGSSAPAGSTRLN